MLVGGSYIGCEVAASLTAHGDEVHDRDDGRRRDVRGLRRGGRRGSSTTSSSRRGSRSSAGRSWPGSRATADVDALVTQERPQGLEGDMVVIGAGVSPDVMLAEKAGLEVRRRHHLRLEARELGRGDLRGRRLLLLRQRRARPPAARRALGRRAAAGPSRGRGNAGRDRALPRGAVLLQRSRRLGRARVRRPGLEWDEVVWRGSADDGEFTVWYLAGGSGGRGPRGRPLRRPHPRPPPARVGRGRLRSRRKPWRTSTRTSRRSAR